MDNRHAIAAGDTADAPKEAPQPPELPRPQDRPYPGTLRLHVDARDVARCIYRMREVIPVAGPGPMTLLYPKWLPGFHSPASNIELLAGLEIRAGGEVLPWRRHEVEVHAFHIEVPAGVSEIEAEFQFLSPTHGGQGDVSMTAAMLLVPWDALLLYPAGYFSRGIRIEASLQLPPDWSAATALDPASVTPEATTYAATSLDVLVDSPVLAGRWFKQVPLDDNGRVRLNLAADEPEQLAATDDQIAAHKALVSEVAALFGSTHYDRYEFLAAVTEELGGAGVEHHASSEIVVPDAYFLAWDANAPGRDVFAHEYVHSWNGKFRRGADPWTPSFERPIRNSLMWVYEGQTQYWGEVLTARAGLWTLDQALDQLALTAAVYGSRPGGRWRPMSDTTRDPIIASRQPLPWPSWQRSEDYYSEGQLLWLDADTKIRELTGDARSLDDFARRFFGVADGRMAVCTYEFGDVVKALDQVAPYDWDRFLVQWLEMREEGAALDGLERGGYRLVYRKTPSDLAAKADARNQVLSLRFSVGLTVGDDGTLQEVIWESPAYRAGCVAGARVVAVNQAAYDHEALKRAITQARDSGKLELLLQRGRRVAPVEIRYADGLRFPHLEPIPAARPRLKEIYAPRR